MNKLLLFLLVLSPFIVFAQPNHFVISGKVVDAQSKLPLESASVFMQNTTIGTTTDASGNFKLALPDGGYDLVITSTSYKTTVIRISTNDVSKKNVVVELKRIEKELAAIIITSGKAEKNGWENYGDFSWPTLLVKHPTANYVQLKTKKYLNFTF